MKRKDRLKKVRDVIVSTKGSFFTVKYKKRSTGEVVDRTCRTNVKKHLKGGEAAYDPAKHDLVTVYDMNRKGYRSIPLENVKEIHANGKTYKFD